MKGVPKWKKVQKLRSLRHLGLKALREWIIEDFPKALRANDHVTGDFLGYYLMIYHIERKIALVQ